MTSFVTHLEAAIDGTRLPHDRVQTLHAGRPLWVRYDLDAIKRAVSRDAITQRPPTIWRYRELLPVDDDRNIVSLGEGMSPLVECPRAARAFGLDRLWIKDESQLPTGSFKSRGLCLLVSRAKELGLRRFAIPTAGNAGAALAAYAARAGLESFVFMPDDTPEVNRSETALFGARAFLVDGLITDCAAIVLAGVEKSGWFDCSTLKEPYRIEGKKTMGLELAEQFGWRLPDVVLYPTGGGTGLIGMRKAFAELAALGWLDDPRPPKLVSVQSDGCAPIVRAFEAGARFAEPFPNAATVASGLRVPKAVGDFMILDAVRDTGGVAVAAPEPEILPAMREVSALEGVSLCPESAACFVALRRFVRDGFVKRTDRVVIFNTGAAQKYVEAMRGDLPRLRKSAPIDWSAFSPRP